MMRILSLLSLAGALLLAGCADTIRTIEQRDGRMTMIELPPGGRPPRNWELKEVSNRTEVQTLRRAGWSLDDRIEHPGGADTFLMKRKLIAQKPAPPAPPFRPLLITALGTNTTPDGAWQIGVTETSLALSHSFKHHRAPGLTVSGWSTISPAEWKAHAGWFVFVESESNVWAYDGDLDLQLNTETTVGNNSTGNTYHSPFPCPVPEVVFSRLSEPVQKRLQNEK